jgi:site-specific recombinase XerD
VDTIVTPPAPAGPALPLAEIAALAPEGLAERLAALAQDLHLAYAANTRRAWRAGWRVWVAFCTTAEPAWPVLPVSVDSLRAFLQARVAADIQRATLDLNVSTLRMVHRLAGIPAWPLDTLEGELMWRGIRRKLSKRQRQKDGLSIDHIGRMLVPLDPSVPIDARDGALLPVAYETQLRRSFLVAMDLEHVLRWDADGTATVLIPKNKEDQEGQGRVKVLTADTTRRLRHWIATAGITEGALWRSVPNRHTPDRFAERLGDGDVARIYKRRATAVGLEATEIAGHSTRIGAAQDMVADGFKNAEIMQEVGWTSEKQLHRYTEHLAAKRGAMARFLKRRGFRAHEAPPDDSGDA